MPGFVANSANNALTCRVAGVVDADGTAADWIKGLINHDEIARLVIQAYGNLMGHDRPTTMLENDRLVETLLNGRITPIAQTRTEAQWKAGQFYDQFRHSIWPASPSFEQEARHKFKGL